MRKLSVIPKRRNPYDGIAIICGDGAYSTDYVLRLREKCGRKKTDLLTMPGGSRSLSGYEEEGHELSVENRERLGIMEKAFYIAFATYLDHGGDVVYLCDHLWCGFWFDYRDPNESQAAQIASMWGGVRKIQIFIKKLKEDSQFAIKYKVNPENIKVKKFILHFASLDQFGDLENIEQVGELTLA